MPTQNFTASGSFTVPANVTSITVECWGGGGGSGGATLNNSGGSGGAGGSYTRSVITVTPNSTFSIQVGAGGLAGNSSGSQGGQGGSSWFNSSGNILATGGAGGSANQGSAGFGSTSGNLGQGTFVFYAGGNGSAGTTSLSGAGGGGAGSSAVGGNASGATAGNGGSGNPEGGTGGVGRGGSNWGGLSGFVTGGGASGGFRFSTTSQAGAAGGRGYVRITWNTPPITDSVTESASASESQIVINNVARSLTESTSASDSNSVIKYSFFVDSISEIASAIDNINSVLSSSSPISESTSATDSISTIKIIYAAAGGVKFLGCTSSAGTINGTIPSQLNSGSTPDGTLLIYVYSSVGNSSINIPSGFINFTFGSPVNTGVAGYTFAYRIKQSGDSSLIPQPTFVTTPPSTTRIAHFLFAFSGYRRIENAFPPLNPANYPIDNIRLGGTLTATNSNLLIPWPYTSIPRDLSASSGELLFGIGSRGAAGTPTGFISPLEYPQCGYFPQSDRGYVSIGLDQIGQDGGLFAWFVGYQETNADVPLNSSTILWINSQQSVPSAGNSFTIAPDGERAYATDLVSLTQTTAPPITEQANATHSQSGSVPSSFSLTESTGSTESQQATNAAVKSLTESISSSDQVLSVTSISISISESISANDSSGRFILTSESLSESNVSSDSFTGSLSTSTSISETSSAIEDISYLLIVPISESISASDQISVIASFNMSVSESAISDHVQGYQGSLVSILVESANVTDQATVILLAIGSIIETASSSESYSTSLSTSLSISENTTSSDNIIGNNYRIESISESVITVDILSGEAGFIAAIVESDASSEDQLTAIRTAGSSISELASSNAYESVQLLIERYLVEGVNSYDFPEGAIPTTRFSPLGFGRHIVNVDKSVSGLHEIDWDEVGA